MSFSKTLGQTSLLLLLISFKLIQNRFPFVEICHKQSERLGTSV